MARHRRLSAAFLVSLALAALVAAATVTGGTQRPAPAAEGAGTMLQSVRSEAALTPAKRQLGEQVSFVVVAVLATLAGVTATGAGIGRLVRRRRMLPAARRHTVRLRGPPSFQLG